VATRNRTRPLRRATFASACAIIPSETSMPVTSPVGYRSISSIAAAPVPVPMSRIRAGWPACDRGRPPGVPGIRRRPTVHGCPSGPPVSRRTDARDPGRTASSRVSAPPRS
jgi:hypothetical protein